MDIITTAIIIDDLHSILNIFVEDKNHKSMRHLLNHSMDRCLDQFLPDVGQYIHAYAEFGLESVKTQ